MATTLVPVLLNAEGANAYTVSGVQAQQRMQEPISSLILHFQSTGSSRVANSTLYDKDFFAWTQTTVALIQAEQWQEIDRSSLTEELEDLGASQRNAVSSNLYEVLIHLLKWRYQPEGRRRGHSWRDSIVEHRDRIDRLCTSSPSLRRFLPDMLAAEYPRARRRASIQTHLPLPTFPESCPWPDVTQVVHEDFWPEP
jgi:hypothetical protein